MSLCAVVLFFEFGPIPWALSTIRAQPSGLSRAIIILPPPAHIFIVFIFQAASYCELGFGDRRKVFRGSAEGFQLEAT